MTLHLHNSAAVSALAPARMITWRSARLGVSSDFWIAGSFRCDESMCVMLLRVLAAAGLKVPELLMCFRAPKVCENSGHCLQFIVLHKAQTLIVCELPQKHPGQR